MFPPMLSDRSHRNIFLPAIRSPFVRNLSIEDQLFDYNVVASRAMKPHRVPLYNMQLPTEGSLLTPRAPIFQAPAIAYDNFTPVSDRKIITELRRPNHIKNTHRPVMPHSTQLYNPQPPMNTPREEYSQLKSRPMADEYNLSPNYPTLLKDQTNQNVELERRKINNIIVSKHNRTQSNVLLPSQSTRNLPVNMYSESTYINENIPKHITSLEKYNIKLKKEVKPQIASENIKPEAPSEASPKLKVKAKPVEEKPKKEEEPSPVTKSKSEDKKPTTHHKSKSDNMRKRAIMNNVQKKSASDPDVSD